MFPQYVVHCGAGGFVRFRKDAGAGGFIRGRRDAIPQVLVFERRRRVAGTAEPVPPFLLGVGLGAIVRHGCRRRGRHDF